MSDWILHTTMRRRWPDGTEFAILPATVAPLFARDDERGYQLTVTHSVGLKAHSWHPTVAAAQAHAEQMMDSFAAAKAQRAKAIS
jgi:hypothetical protein